MMLRQRWFSSPGTLYHHKNVATLAMNTSTYIPAAPIAARCHLLGNIHESLTLQYSAGVNTKSMKPISWHSPLKCLQLNQCPNSCNTLTIAMVMPSQIQLCAPKNSWKVGRRERKVSN